MVRLNLPQYPVRVVDDGGNRKIWDPVRKKYLALTPEEWVRQHIIQFLHHEKGCPLSLVKVETGLKVNQLFRRTDILIYSSIGEPVMLVECKAPEVKINQNTFDQIARYNIPLKVPYLLVSNGMNHYCCRINHGEGQYQFLKDIPGYSEMTL